MKNFFKLTKSGIVWFVLLSAAIGYAMGAPLATAWDWNILAPFLFGLYLVSSGSFAINQAQEWSLDALMPRTKTRPIPGGIYKPWQAYLIGFLMVAVGGSLIAVVSVRASLLALATVALYNGLYTIYWKRKWNFGAVPGAIPGAMPVLIGYAVGPGPLITPESVYLFMIMFLWQMPHFWCLAIRFKDDYAKAGVPVLPVSLGVYKTLYHIGLYMVAYVGLALASPMFTRTHVFYLLAVIPLSIKLVVEFYRYFESQEQKRWLPFFMWVNFSMLAFIAAPVADRWLDSWLLTI